MSLSFHAFLYSVEGKRIEKEPIPGKEIFTIPDEKTAHEIVEKLKMPPIKSNMLKKRKRREILSLHSLPPRFNKKRAAIMDFQLRAQ